MYRQQRLTDGLRQTATAIIAVAIFGAWSCKKASPETSGAIFTPREDNASVVFESVRLQYKDSILYPRTFPKNYNVKPIRTPKQPGFFVSNPEGLQINSLTGTIEVNNSEAGLHYRVYYLSPNNEPIDSATIIIAGIDYNDGIFELAATPEHEKAIPVYEGMDTTFPCPRGEGDDNDQGENVNVAPVGPPQCTFDETDLDGDGRSDIGGVNLNKLKVNQATGAIDLEESFNAGVFGLNPANGIYKDFTIYYRLSDVSQRALNKITVRLYHFTSRDKIPASLIEELAHRKENYSSVGGPVSAGNSFQSNLIYLAPKRPPLIIIVSGYRLL